MPKTGVQPEEYLKKLEGKQETDIVIRNALATKMVEMWSSYHDKSHQIWLWWAADHKTNTPLALKVKNKLQ